MDMICVLDVSGSMQGAKIQQVQSAVRFITDQARETDRISIVTFNSQSARILRLRKMDTIGKSDAEAAIASLRASGGTSIGAGLNTAIRVMEERRQRNTVSALLLLTDGIDGSVRSQIPGLVSRVTAAECSLYCFGFGADHDAALLSSISEQARTPFTFVENVENIREAFAGTMGGLASIMAQNLVVSLRARVPLKEVHTPFRVVRNSEMEATVTIPDIMAEERRDILVELSVPAEETGPLHLVLLEVVVGFLDLHQGVQLETPPVIMELECVDEPQPEMEPDEEVSVQRERVEVTKALREAAKHSDEGQYESAQRVIESMQTSVRSKKTKNMEAMGLELQDASARMASRAAWERGGRAEVNDAMTMHSMQRCTNVSVTAGASVQKRSKAMYASKRQVSMIEKSQREF